MLSVQLHKLSHPGCTVECADICNDNMSVPAVEDCSGQDICNVAYECGPSVAYCRGNGTLVFSEVHACIIFLLRLDVQLHDGICDTQQTFSGALYSMNPLYSLHSSKSLFSLEYGFRLQLTVDQVVFACS